MSNTVSTRTALRFLAMSAFALSILPWSLGAATPVAAASVSGNATDAVSDIQLSGLPDLRATEIKVLNVPGSSQNLLCLAIQNFGTLRAGPFDSEFKIDGVAPPGGVVSAGMLGAGQKGELCIQTTLPAKGRHVLSAVVDSAGTVAELNETNNAISRQFVGPQTLNTDAVFTAAP